MSKAVVLISGGTDSFLSALRAKEQHSEVVGIFFNYGQITYLQELEAVTKSSNILGIALEVVDISCLSSLLSCDYVGKDISKDKSNFKSMVPNRNLLFLTLATNFCYLNGFLYLYTGFYDNHKMPADSFDKVVEKATIEDSSILTHPSDQTLEFLVYAEKAINKSLEGNSSSVKIMNPIHQLTKVEIVSEIVERGYKDTLETALTSCYHTDQTKHPWGVGCGECFPCKNRELAYKLK